MKTAEELFKEMYAGIRKQLTLQEVCVRCMEEYAIECNKDREYLFEDLTREYREKVSELNKIKATWWYRLFSIFIA